VVWGCRFTAVTRREQALALFHLLGRLFYNKRMSLNFLFGVRMVDMAGVGFGDPDEPGEAPPQIVTPLPEHLAQFERRTSKVDIAVSPSHN
jgi:cell cycle checkpoint protein